MRWQFLYKMSRAERHLRLVDDSFINELNGLSGEVDSADEQILRIDSRITRIKRAPIPHSTYVRRRIGVAMAAAAVVGAVTLSAHAITDNGDKLSCVSIGTVKTGQDETPQQLQGRAMRGKGIDPSTRTSGQLVDDAICAKDSPQPDISSNGMKTVFISE